MEEQMLRVTESNGIVRLTMNRPQKRNALTREMLGQMLDVLRRVGSDPKTRLVVLAGEGSVFCAGMDLGQMRETTDDPRSAELFQHDAQVYRDVVGELFALPCPTMSIVQGPAVGGGVGLALACDVAIGSTEVSFALPETRRGIIAAIVTPILIFRVTAGRAGYLLFSGQAVKGEMALRMGLVHEVVPLNELATREATLCRSILTGSPNALIATKEHVNRCSGSLIQQQLDQSVTASAVIRETPDAREGLAAFLEKRPPSWELP